MKKLLVLLLPLLLTACLEDIPVTPKWPDIPDSLKTSCPALKQLDDGKTKLSDIIDNSLANSSYGDISRDGKYDQWLVRQYANGAMDYEDLTGEGADALGAFKALGRRGVLKPFHQDINKFRSLRQLITVIMGRGSPYQAALQSMRDEATLNKMKRDKREVVLIDDENFYVTIPLNYGACYYFNNALGVRASFCTGSSSTSWFGRYAGEGPMIDILNKKEIGRAHV